jgi:hypothetical protein
MNGEVRRKHRRRLLPINERPDAETMFGRGEAPLPFTVKPDVGYRPQVLRTWGQRPLKTTAAPDKGISTTRGCKR